MTAYVKRADLAATRFGACAPNASRGREVRRQGDLFDAKARKMNVSIKR